MLLRKWPPQRHKNCEYGTYNKTITYTHLTRFRSKNNKFQIRNNWITIWRTNFFKWSTLHALFQKQETYYLQRWFTLSTILQRSWRSQSLQVLLPGQLLKVLLQSLHRGAGKHPGISKMIQEIRQKFYFPSIATYVRNWVHDCEICIQDKLINNTRITLDSILIPEWDHGPQNLMHIDLLPKLPPSGGHENIITARDVFSRYPFAYSVSNPTAVNIAEAVINIMTRHAYLPTPIITDKGSVFLSQFKHEVAEILGINLKHATTKHAQTIGVLGRAHTTIKTSLKTASG